MADVNLWSALPPAIGMLLVAAIALLFWRYVSKADWKWFWVGAGLWIVAVIIKRVIGLALASILFPRCLSWFFQVLCKVVSRLALGSYSAAAGGAAGRTTRCAAG